MWVYILGNACGQDDAQTQRQTPTLAGGPSQRERPPNPLPSPPATPQLLSPYENSQPTSRLEPDSPFGQTDPNRHMRYRRQKQMLRSSSGFSTSSGALPRDAALRLPPAAPPPSNTRGGSRSCPAPPPASPRVTPRQIFLGTPTPKVSTLNTMKPLE